jgi:hypothetical protein
MYKNLFVARILLPNKIFFPFFCMSSESEMIFQVLLDAVVSLSSKITIPTQQITTKSKRKYEELDPSDSKKVYKLTDKFKSTHIDDVFLDIENNVNIQVNRQELSEILKLINMPCDSFSKFKTTTEKIYYHLKSIPLRDLEMCKPWKAVEHNLLNRAKFITIVDDIKATVVSQNHDQVLENLEVFVNIIQEKSIKYGSFFVNDALHWRILGFPVADILCDMNNFKNSMLNMLYNYICAVNQALTTLNIPDTFRNWEKVLFI